MKNAQRLDDARLAEVLNERGMADLEAIREMLQTSRAGGTPFCEAVVSANLVSDWDLSRVVAELFQLPFVTVEICKPDPELWEELESPTLCENGLVPLQRFGQVVTLAMPGLVPADILGLVAAETDMVLLPVVGTVETNQRWIEQHKTEDGDAAKPRGNDWGSLFDQADAAVQADLIEDPEEEGLAAVEIEADLDLEGELGLDDVDLAEIEFTSTDDDAGLEPPSLVDLDSAGGEPSTSSGPIDLPPVPDFE